MFLLYLSLFFFLPPNGAGEGSPTEVLSATITAESEIWPDIL